MFQFFIFYCVARYQNNQFGIYIDDSYVMKKQMFNVQFVRQITL